MTTPVHRASTWIRGSENPFRLSLPGRASGFTRARAFNRHVKDLNIDEARDSWSTKLGEPGEPFRAETIARSYEGAITRATRVEAKAAALLQVIAIGFAIVALIADRQSWVLRLLSLLAIAYLSLATVGAVELLKPRSQRQVLSSNAHAHDGGLIATALAAQSLEAGNTRASNTLFGVLQDLQVGLAAALMCLVLIVAGVGSPKATSPTPAGGLLSPEPSPTIPASTTTRASKPNPTAVVRTSTGAQAPAATTARNAPEKAPLLRVLDQNIQSGAEFRVMFSGRLASSRGGYFNLIDRSGTVIALLRSDGNNEIPMGYETNPERFVQFDDALTGEGPSQLQLPPTVTPGAYQLCTANSVRPTECAGLVVTDANDRPRGTP